MRNAVSISSFLLLLLCTLPYASSVEEPGSPPVLGYRVIQCRPHDRRAFTQGLIYHNGFFYESTGLYGESSLREVRPDTGKVLREKRLPDRLFGEGLVLYRNRLIQLTWQAGVAYVYDRETFDQVGTFKYEGQGWGLTTDGKYLIMSDGTAWLRFLDADTFEEIRRIEVRAQGKRVPQLNELEYVHGEILANVWHTDLIAKISPKTGKVTGWVDLSELRRLSSAAFHIDVLNGIAFDAESGRVFVTGKLWPWIYEIELLPPESHPESSSASVSR